MRKNVFLLLGLLMFALPASAAPTCVDINGDTIRCGASGAMPVGWTPTPQQLLKRHSSKLKNPGAEEVLGVVAIFILFLTFIALLPEFDGTQSSDWGEQEGDEGNPSD